MKGTGVNDRPVLLVIDIEDKTNTEVKQDVSRTVGNLFENGLKQLPKEIVEGDKIESMIVYALILKEIKKETKKMLRQFYIQIDNLVPQDT